MKISRVLLFSVLSAAVLAWSAAAQTKVQIKASTVERKTCAAPDGVTIVYSATGSGKVGLVFIHGGLANRGFWDHELKTFAAQYRVVAPDLPGHGESGTNRQKWGIREFGADVRAVVKAEHLEKVILFGNSVGGPIAIEAALLMPGKVLGVVGVDTFNSFDWISPQTAQKRADAFRADYAGSMRAMIKMLFHDDADPALMADAEQRMLRTSPEAADSILRSLGGYDLEAAVRRLTVPLRAINGDRYPTDIEGNRKIKADFDAVIMKHMGHYPMLERPAEFDRLVSAVVAALMKPSADEVPPWPAARGYHAMAYDSRNHRVILFGGQTGDGVRYPDAFLAADTWIFDPVTKLWTEGSPSASPQKMSADEIAYDAELDRVILFSGVNLIDKRKDTLLRETWAYDPNRRAWKQMADGPPGRFGHRMAYDSESDRIILFGGAYMDQGVKHFRDTWAYDFNTDTWTEMKPAASPPGRHYYGMVYDSRADRGWLDDQKEDSSIWAYDFNHNTWTETKTTGGPKPIGYLAMAYDSKADRVIVFGGGGDGSNETWAYDYGGNRWAEMPSTKGPGKLSRLSMVYSPIADRCILFGGQLDNRQFTYSDETWLYDFNHNMWENAAARQGEYLGLRRPGKVPEVFAPGVISTDAYEHGAPALSPDGQEIYWSVFDEKDIGQRHGPELSDQGVMRQPCRAAPEAFETVARRDWRVCRGNSE